MKLLKSYLLIIICILFSFSSICNASISRTEIDTSTKKHHPNQKRFLQIDFGGHIIAVDTDDFVYLHNGPSSQNYVLTNDEYEIVICDYLFYTSEDINTKDINTKPLKELRTFFHDGQVSTKVRIENHIKTKPSQSSRHFARDYAAHRHTDLLAQGHPYCRRCLNHDMLTFVS